MNGFTKSVILAALVVTLAGVASASPAGQVRASITSDSWYFTYNLPQVPVERRDHLSGNAAVDILKSGIKRDLRKSPRYKAKRHYSKKRKWKQRRRGGIDHRPRRPNGWR